MTPQVAVQMVRHYLNLAPSEHCAALRVALQERVQTVIFADLALQVALALLVVLLSTWALVLLGFLFVALAVLRGLALLVPLLLQAVVSLQQRQVEAARYARLAQWKAMQEQSVH